MRERIGMYWDRLLLQRSKYEPAGTRANTRQQAKKTARIGGFFNYSGGEGGIRTRVRLSPKHAFQACDLNRSSTSPQRLADVGLVFLLGLAGRGF